MIVSLINEGAAPVIVNAPAVGVIIVPLINEGAAPVSVSVPTKGVMLVFATEAPPSPENGAPENGACENIVTSQCPTGGRTEAVPPSIRALPY